jgi:hypothetical protein
VLCARALPLTRRTPGTARKVAASLDARFLSQPPCTSVTVRDASAFANAPSGSRPRFVVAVGTCKSASFFHNCADGYVHPSCGQNVRPPRFIVGHTLSASQILTMMRVVMLEGDEPTLGVTDACFRCGQRCGRACVWLHALSSSQSTAVQRPRLRSCQLHILRPRHLRPLQLGVCRVVARLRMMSRLDDGVVGARPVISYFLVLLPCAVPFAPFCALCCYVCSCISTVEYAHL